MNIKNKLKLIKAINILHRFEFKDEDVMLVGSIALDLQGFLPDREAHDVDFIIKMDDNVWKILQVFEKILKNDITNDYPDHKNVVITLDGVTLNIWKANGEEHLSGLKFGDMNVKPAGEILKVKKSYGRAKDLKDISEICKEIL